ncbi:DMT family transporter [Noviherbaspirillum galbum]|uniref:DMT family transporter n=1 Tax=Noviherbaspirillum galbum TaxID=2709383 RepID=A0A6B3SYP8_9BURK|nr:DMT family transporter [Noviherbaspirillum galbum]NEX63209.1 DMT family transporter [Noviherbaspirillum galbum]
MTGLPAACRNAPYTSCMIPRSRLDAFYAWFFVLIWGSGYLASKTGMQYAPPFTFLALRYSFGVLCLLAWVGWSKPQWPASRTEFFHVCVAGLLMHAVNLGGSHYAQYLGMSAGVTALLLATQPLLTAVYAHHRLGERLDRLQWLGVLLGLCGVALVVWHKINLKAVTAGSLVAVTISLLAITSGTLYQRRYCKSVDLRSASLIQFGASLLVVAPLGWAVEGFPVRWSWPLVISIFFLVIFASILAVNVLNTMMRQGHAAKVTSLLFLTPIVAVLLEWLMFGVVPTGASVAGIVVTCLGVAMVSRRKA